MFTGTENLQARKAAEIAQLIHSQNPLIIASTYKGIILTQPIQVLSVAPGRVVIQAPDLEICFTLKERIQLFSRNLRLIISAKLLAINCILGELELADLSLTGCYWCERRSDRVRPRDPILVEGEHDQTRYRANLDTLSEGGISLMIYERKGKFVPLDPQSTMRMGLHLPGDARRLYLKGKIVREQQIGKMERIGMQLMCSSAQEKHINRYVVARKAEIMTELEQVSREHLAQCVFWERGRNVI
jgi:hypothetical protein